MHLHCNWVDFTSVLLNNLQVLHSLNQHEKDTVTQVTVTKLFATTIWFCCVHYLCLFQYSIHTKSKLDHAILPLAAKNYKLHQLFKVYSARICIQRSHNLSVHVQLYKKSHVSQVCNKTAYLQTQARSWGLEMEGMSSVNQGCTWMTVKVRMQECGTEWGMEVQST